MKNNLILGMAIASMLFSCTSDDTADIIINDSSSVVNNNGGNNNGEDSCTTILAAEYTSDLELEANKCYVINGPVIMTDGTNLIINEGVTIYAEATGADVYIAISQGAKILANGTANSPIVFTSSAASPSAGDWGGLILLGKAPINSATGTSTSTSEIASLPYGGNLTNDSSGTLRYVRVEYSGGAADGQAENNGISFYGVGNETVVEYIQAFEGKDDGVEFFGGTVNVSYVSVINAQDDSIDWTEGYTGTITNAYVKHGAEHDKGVEADGYNTDFSNEGGYYSKPTINNLTIVGLGTSADPDSEAIRLRAGTQGVFNNVLLQGYGEGFDLDGDSGDNPTGNGVISGDLHVTNVTFTDVTLSMKNDTGVTFTEANFITGAGNGTGTDYATWGASWTVE
ncbi:MULTISPECIES: multidrug transporter [Bizionia]|uniref:Multidrug transporter n=1 Tax=Bizionia algoritergicola TaxID=291187 RepID=A0A5D0R1M1_9FLAO|nr:MULTISPECIES: multidrug transporter [Bizionia]OBX23690.1 multidrug transporter [Bizionia sp. APA-3]TYB75412.1 multidrug transporter [Bizionia algoritergicola]